MLSPISTSIRVLTRIKATSAYYGSRGLQRARTNKFVLTSCSSSLSTKSSARQNRPNPLTAQHEAADVDDRKGEKGTPVVRKASEGETAQYKTSFGKDIFLGNFDYTLLIFPEVLEKEQYETLHEMLTPIERFYEEKVDSKKIDTDAKIPEDVLQGLKDLGLYGQQVPHEYGGLGLNATEYARLQEIIALDGAIMVTLAAHQTIGYKGLLLYGNEEQKQKYLPKLASGEMVGAFALTEPSSGSDAGSIKTKATMSRDGTHWTLNGNKIWISNGGTADFFTVFARTAQDGLETKSSKAISAFMVERSFEGLTSGKPEDKHGIRGSNTTEVHFDNVKVPLENMLGEEGDGFKIAMNILNSGRFSMGSAGAGFLKKLMSMVADHAINRKQFGKPLAEFGIIQEKFAKLAMDIYVMEAMAYTTAGLIDSGEYEDCAQEAAMVKIYSSEAGYNGISECLQILGGMGYMKDYPVERALRDARIMSIFEGTNEILRLLVALNGAKHAGKGLKDLVKKMRNPFQNPNLIFKKIFERRHQLNDNPKLTLHLDRYLHPSLENVAKQCLEYSVLRLQYATECLLEKHGANIVDEQIQLKRLANVAIDVYAMTCALSRASRAYCIGLRNAGVEMNIAELFCIKATQRVRYNVECMLGGPGSSGDVLKKSIAEEIFKNKGYCCEHPLKRTFW